MAVRGFKVVIADESHVMRTTTHAPDSRHTEAVSVACKRAKRVTMLTGTPSLSRPFDLYRQVVTPSLIRNSTAWMSLNKQSPRPSVIALAQAEHVKVYQTRSNGIVPGGRMKWLRLEFVLSWAAFISCCEAAFYMHFIISE